MKGCRQWMVGRYDTYADSFSPRRNQMLIHAKRHHHHRIPPLWIGHDHLVPGALGKPEDALELVHNGAILPTISPRRQRDDPSVHSRKIRFLNPPFLVMFCKKAAPSSTGLICSSSQMASQTARRSHNSSTNRSRERSGTISPASSCILRNSSKRYRPSSSACI